MSEKREKFARFGIATKGFVYCLIGTLTAMTALGLGGKKTGSGGALEYLSNQTYGQVLLTITALGLLGFVFWRFYQAFAGSDSNDDESSSTLKRIGYFVSAVFYTTLSISAFSMVFGNSSSSGDSKESMISTLLSQSFGQIVVGILGAIFIGKAIYQFYTAYSGKYKEKVKNASLSKKARKIVLPAGKIGYTSRGIVIGIIGFLIIRAAMTANSSQAGGTKEAFNVLQNEFGSIVLAVVAIGLIAYGVFMIIKSRYKEMSLS